MAQVEKLGRGARRKAITREKLLAAGQRLLSVKDLTEVSVQDLTEEADVGLGTFYNHFESKADVLTALSDEYLESYFGELEWLLADLQDPAEIVCVGYRHTLAQALDKQNYPILQQMSSSYLHERMTQRAIADIENGIRVNRFKIDNLNSFVGFLNSVLVGVMEQYSEGALSKAEAEHTTVYFLRSLGLDEAEASALGTKPMPKPKTRKLEGSAVD